MAKRVISGVEKRIKKPLIRRKLKKKSLFKKVLDYLKSDSYMFAPLVSHYYPNCDFLASNAVVYPSPSTPPGVEINNRELGKNNINEGLVEKVGNYLYSDSYLYAPLFAPHYIPSSKGVNGEHRRNRVRIELSRNKILQKGNERTVEKSKITVEKVNGEDDVPETRNRRSISGQEKLVQKGTVNHMVCQSCRTSSMSGKRLDPRLRRKHLME